MGEPRGRGLAGSRSPFLQHGATQPVDWLPWGAEAFERARRENRPILLDIGAVWCHWCHVMDRESYEDAGTAALINELYVPVKVDRDERPDVDARYQRAVQVLTGQGGWPLTAFLTPDGEVFYGGTYFPPEDTSNRPSFRRVLREIARVWREEPERTEEAVRGVRERLAAYTEVEAAPGEPSAELVAAALDELADTFDVRYGGFGRAPKFPNAGGLDLLVDAWLDRREEWVRRIALESLTAMARGGIVDQLGGGFHRYSTDARWIVPHFEKMAADNGVLARTYARAFPAFNEPILAETVDGILAHPRDIAPALVEAGGFPASQDADYGSDNDGDYWTWTHAEVEAALDGDTTAVRIATLRFGLDDPAGSMHLDPERRVLFRAMEADAIAARMEMSGEDVARAIGDVATRLKQVRDARPRPFVDETQYADLIGYVASGHLAAARHLGRPDARDAALRALDRAWRDGFDAERGMAHRIGDREAGEGLADQVAMASASLDAFEITQRREYLDRAAALADVTIARFSAANGAFLDRPEDAEVVAAPLARPHYPITDSPEPSGNGTAALVLLRLHELTGGARWRERALAVLRAFASAVPKFPSAAATYVQATARATLPVTRIVIVADPGSEIGGALLATALRIPRPRTSVLHLEPGADTSGLPEELAAMITGETPRAYLCAGTTCAAPVAEPEALASLITSFRA